MKNNYRFFISLAALFLVAVVAAFTFGCSSDSATAKDGLDLQALPKLVRESKDAEQLEAKLNATGSINNLDLDEDGNVDYINVTEYGQGDKRGFSLTVEVPGADGKPPELQEVANISLDKTPQSVNLAVNGNEQIYGRNERYESSFGLDDFLMMSWLMNASRPVYVSPYHYNQYPPTYTRYKTIERTVYRDRTAPMRTGQRVTAPTLVKQPLSSPNATRTASTIKAPLSNPSMSQRTFQKQNPSRTFSSSGFSKSSGSSTTRSTSTSSRSSSSSSSSRSSSRR